MCMKSVVGIAYEAKNEIMRTFGFFEGEAALRIGNGSFLGSFPVNIYAGKRNGVVVYVFIHDAAQRLGLQKNR